MFTILEYSSPPSRNPHFSSVQHFPSPSAQTLHAACDFCREKKVKCSGEKRGCARCRFKGRICTYQTAEEKANRKWKRRKISHHWRSGQDRICVMPPPAAPSGNSSGRCLQNICSEGKSMQNEGLEFLQLDEIASSSVTELGTDSNKCIYPDNMEELDLDANVASTCTSMHLKKSTPHESSRGPKKQTQTDRRGSSPALFGKDFDPSSWQLESIISDEPTRVKRRSPNSTSLGSESLLSEHGESSTTREDESPDKYFDQAFALITPSITTDGSPMVCGPDSLDQTFEELSGSDCTSTTPSQNSSPARQCSMDFTGQYENGNQSAALDFASTPASDKSLCMLNSPAIGNLDTPCQCIPRALSILEDLEVSSFHHTPTEAVSPDDTLSCLRRCLQRCSEILECKLLKWSSEFLVLLTVISRNMLDTFDKLLDSLDSQQAQAQAQAEMLQHNKKWSNSFPPPPSLPPSPLFCKCSLGKYRYELESPEEITCLMNWLVLIQTKRLATLIGRLRKKVTDEEEYNNWAETERHHSILSLLGQRCLQLVRRIKKRRDLTSTVDESGAAAED